MALVLKLNENRFKPLFAELAEWGGNLPAYAAASARDTVRAAAATARRCAWLALVSHLSRALRSVFTPYFQNVLDTICDSVTSRPAAPLTAPSRKKQKASATAARPAVASAAPAESDPGGNADLVVLRNRAVACMHRCCMHDTQGFITADRFERFLTPLVARVAAEGARSATPGDAPETPEAEEDGDLTAAVQLGSRTRLRRSAVAAVAALAQLGVTAQDDAAWKRLNNQVRRISPHPPKPAAGELQLGALVWLVQCLGVGCAPARIRVLRAVACCDGQRVQVMMLTRSEAAGTRLAAVEAAYNLAARLRSDVIALLPETLPFLSELLEDSAAAVAARNAELIALLEEISGEDLQEYLRP